MTLYAGTSGWAYKEWKPGFYPEKLPQTRFLEHYATRLGACEINNTFYSVAKPTAIAKWVAATPEDFRFTAKAHRALTYAKSVAPNERAAQLLDDFLTSVRGLGPRLGAVFFQYPKYRKRDDDGFATLLESLPNDIPKAFEFLDESWHAPDMLETIAAAGGTVVVTDRTGEVPEALPPGPIAYIRFRVEKYTEEQRTAWRDLLTKEATERDVYAFAKHEADHRTIPTEESGSRPGWPMPKRRNSEARSFDATPEPPQEVPEGA